ncbi:DUF89 family protein, partial [bacterium]|nr:DUF89 family protein [bacterium]
MRIKPDCLICVLRQCLEATSLARADEEKAFLAIKEAGKLIPQFTLNDTPMSVTLKMHRAVRLTLGVNDPYKEVKKEFNEKGAKAYPYLCELMSKSGSPLETAVRIAIGGNIVDYALPIEKDLDKSLNTALNAPLPAEDWKIFTEELSRVKNIFYLLDNAGEIFYDKILIEHLLKEGYNVKVAVRGGPAINDATLEDAEYAGLTEMTDVITTGIDTVGFIFELASPEFLKVLSEAELIIAKGQANLESLDETEYPA